MQRNIEIDINFKIILKYTQLKGNLKGTIFNVQCRNDIIPSILRAWITSVQLIRYQFKFKFSFNRIANIIYSLAESGWTILILLVNLIGD